VEKAKMTVPNQYVGISTNIFDNPEDINSLVMRYAALGFKAIEVEIDNEARKILSYSTSDLDNVIKKLIDLKNNHSLSLSVHAPYIGRNTDIASKNDAQRTEAVGLMIDTMMLTHQLGAKVITIHPGYLDRTLEPKEQFKILKNSLQTLKKEAEILGLDVCIENIGNDRPNYMVLQYSDHKEIFEQYGMRLTLDLIHYTSFKKVSCDSYYPEIKEILPFTGNIHIADMLDQKHAHLPLGKGNLPYNKILSFVYANGYIGNSIVEERGGKYSPEEYIESALNYKQTLTLGAEK
jgi:sugar phosphate isomerase/epimerase